MVTLEFGKKSEGIRGKGTLLVIELNWVWKFWGFWETTEAVVVFEFALKVSVFCAVSTSASNIISASAASSIVSKSSMGCKLKLGRFSFMSPTVMSFGFETISVGCGLFFWLLEAVRYPDFHTFLFSYFLDSASNIL